MADYLTQRQLGRKYGVGSHQVGKWLVEWGLRSKNGRPSDLAPERVNDFETPARRN